MKVVLLIVLVGVTVALLVAGLMVHGPSSGTVGIASGSSLVGFKAGDATPEQALGSFLTDVQRRNWDRAYSAVEKANESLDEQGFIQEWIGTNGGLRAFSNLEGYDSRPLHASDTDAQMRVTLHWATPVGPVEFGTKRLRQACPPRSCP
jgi:hypothetical protein